ncbi:MAG: type VI secretion system baseplate subunit TssG [Acidobacteriota bacterium]
MATQNRTTDTTLAQLLFEQPYRFEFFQAVRLLERLAPQRQPVGYNNDPASEVARFRTYPSLSFPPAEIRQLLASNRNGDKDRNAELFVNFIGLTGPLGVLPHPYTELLMERRRFKDRAIWEFFDIFNHRLISLFFRAWVKYRFPIAYERGKGSPFTEYLFSIIGMGTGGLRGRLSFADEGLLRFSGLISQRPHSASATEAILSDYFGVPAQIEQFFWQWLKLDEGSITRLGQANSQLGINTVVGIRVGDNQSKFRLRLGPLSLQRFKAFLPVGSAFKPVTELLRLLVGLELDFDLQLVLKAAEVPYCALSRDSKKQPRLGWTSWLKTREFTADDAQVVLRAN